MSVKDVSQWTRKELEALPLRKWDDETECRCIVILPTRRKHDSGYLAMDFVAVNEQSVPICRLSGCSDVIHLGGICAGVLPNHPAQGWSIDCLPKSRLLRVFSPTAKTLIAGSALSSFELFGKKGLKLEKREAQPIVSEAKGLEWPTAKTAAQETRRLHEQLNHSRRCLIQSGEHGLTLPTATAAPSEPECHCRIGSDNLDVIPCDACLKAAAADEPRPSAPKTLTLKQARDLALAAAAEIEERRKASRAEPADPHAGEE